MRCQTIVELFRVYLFENTDDVDKNLVPHLQNCEYCRRDCQTLLSKYPERITNLNGVNWQRIRQALYQVVLNQKISYSFTLLETKSFWEKCFVELEQAKQDFITDPKRFILSVLEEFWPVEDRPYWSKSWKVATSIWRCSLISLCTYGIYGFDWFASSKFFYYSEKQARESQYIVTYLDTSTKLSPKWLPGYSSKNSPTNKQKLELKPKQDNIKIATNPVIKRPLNLYGITNKINMSNNKQLPVVSSVIAKLPSAKPTNRSISSGARFIISDDTATTRGKAVIGFVKGEVVQPSKSSTRGAAIVAAVDDSDDFDDDYDPVDNGQTSTPNSNQLSLNAQSNSRLSFSSVPNSQARGNFSVSNTGNQPAGDLLPVTVAAKMRVLNPKLKVGQLGLMGFVLIDGGGQFKISGASLNVSFDPNVIKIVDIKDGGLLSLMGTQADFKPTLSSGQINISISRPIGVVPVLAWGQVALIYYQAVGEGEANIKLTDVILKDPNGVSYIPVPTVVETVTIYKQ